MEVRVFLRIKVAGRLAGCLVHDPRIPRVLRLQPLADPARQAADDVSHCAVRAPDSFTIEAVQNEMQGHEAEYYCRHARYGQRRAIPCLA